jgi:hypothetical protein
VARRPILFTGGAKLGDECEVWKPQMDVNWMAQVVKDRHRRSPLRRCRYIYRQAALTAQKNCMRLASQFCDIWYINKNGKIFQSILITCKHTRFQHAFYAIFHTPLAKINHYWNPFTPQLTLQSLTLFFLVLSYIFAISKKNIYIFQIQIAGLNDSIFSVTISISFVWPFCSVWLITDLFPPKLDLSYRF